jgi:PTH1 family peptidyl-tRNA hydrolase
VLGKFTPDEKKIIKEVLFLAEDAIEFSLKQGLEKSMSLYNPKSINSP